MYVLSHLLHRYRGSFFYRWEKSGQGEVRGERREGGEICFTQQCRA